MEAVQMIRWTRYEKPNESNEKYENKDQNVSSMNNNIRIETARCERQQQEGRKCHCGWKKTILKENDN